MCHKNYYVVKSCSENGHKTFKFQYFDFLKAYMVVFLKLEIIKCHKSFDFSFLNMNF